ncbi:MAG: sulfatase-like hydrolase/transferase [Methanolobus sp.]|nr:sulfatase-like hydrolase/transferase [Methanolobus sp.]
MTAVKKFPLLLILILFTFSTCAATEIIEIDNVNTPQGAVIFIADGLSSCYVYPEYTPYAIDGNMLDKADMDKMNYIFDQSCRVLDVTAPQTYTEGGHSVLATGYSKADGILVGSSGTTIYDIAHDYGYMTFGVMQKGDSSGMRSKQHVIIHDISNSVNKPVMVTEMNMISDSDKSISFAVAELMQDHFTTLQPLLNKHPEGSQHRYDIYNIWAIEAGIGIIDLMSTEYPDQNYLLTINAGAIDSAGHYKKDSGYLASIEGIDNATMELYLACLENNIAFILTGDHGMGFPTRDSRGGHQSDKYSGMPESQKVPFVIAAKDVNTGIIDGQFGQEDIAPTILEILNIPGKLRVADGISIPVKDYVNIKVNVPGTGNLLLMKDEVILFENTVHESIAFLGLVPDSNHILKYTSSSDTDKEIEMQINTVSSMVVDIHASSEHSQRHKSSQNPRYIIGGGVIGIVNLAGLVLIRKVLKE